MWVASSVGNACAARIFPCWHAESWIPRWDCTVVDAPCWLVPRSWLISTFILLMIQIIPGTILVSWTFGEFLAWLHSGTWTAVVMADPTKFKVYASPSPTGSFDGVEFQACTVKVVWAAVFQLAGAALWACSSATKLAALSKHLQNATNRFLRFPSIIALSGSCIFAWTDAMSVAWKASTSRDSIARTGFCKASIKHQPGQLLN